VRRSNVLVVAGEPICTPADLNSVSKEFELFARRQNGRVCYACAGERMRDTLSEEPGHAGIVLGAQPVWDPRGWPELLRRHSAIRQQINRASNKSVEIEPTEPATEASTGGLKSILSEWMLTRAMPPLHFLAEPDILGSLSDGQMILVARRCGHAVAFLVASPIAARNGYLIELLARSRNAPNGTSELLIDGAMRHAAASGASYLTLGLVALARAADGELHQNPLWVRGMMRFARAHASRFYRFGGLEYFRAKLAPAAWEPVYAIANERRFSWSTLYALGGAFSGIAPWRAIAIGAAQAARAECEGLRDLWNSALERAVSRIVPGPEAS